VWGISRNVSLNGEFKEQASEVWLASSLLGGAEGMTSFVLAAVWGAGV